MIILSWSCAYLSSTAQNTKPCNAAFTYQANGNTVKFFAAAASTNHTQRHQWQFGDGGNSSEVNPVHGYSSTGSYKVLHIVKDSLENCVDSVMAIISIDSTHCSIEPKFEWRRDSADCRRIWFINHSVPISPNVNFTWEFGDNSTSSDAYPSHQYAQPGNYTVCLTISSISPGCYKEICKTVEVRCDSCPLQIGFKYEEDSAHPEKVYFKSTLIKPDSATPHYQWSFGDGSGSDDPDPFHIYNVAGTYYICLKVAINNTCIREICKKIVVGNSDSCHLTAKFDYKIDSVYRNKVYFINQTISNRNNNHYLWKFGDGNTSDDFNPVHVYNHAGEYEVCLVVETGIGCRSEYCTKIEIRTDFCNITSKFEWKAGDNPLKIYFHNLTVTTSGAIHYLWKFGDGSTSGEINPVHVYEKGGEYDVCLVSEWNNICRNVTCEKIVVGSPDCNVRARFEWKKDENNIRKIWFANVSEPVSHIWQTYWSYGDNTISQDFNSFHEYNSTGQYRVCLKVISLDGCSNTFCDSVIVREHTNNCDDIKLKFEYKPNEERSNKISFHAISDHNIKKQKWIIQRDSAVNGFPYIVVLDQNDPAYIFPFTGSYTVCLDVTYENGCAKEYCERLLISEVVNGAVILPAVPLYPNPARNTVRLELKLDRAVPVRVTVLDPLGSQKLIMYVNGQTGNNIITIPVSKLSQGQYLVQMVFANQVRLARFQRM